MRPYTSGNNLVAATPTVIYTVPKGYCTKWSLLYVLNGSGSTKYITVSWYQAKTATTVSILYEYSVNSKEFFKIGDGNYMVLEEGDYVTVTSEAGSTFSTIATFEQIKKEGI